MFSSGVLNVNLPANLFGKRFAFGTEPHSVDTDRLKLVSFRKVDFGQFDVVKAIDAVAHRANEMYMFVVMVMLITFGRAQGIGSGAVEIKYFMENPLFFKSRQHPIKCHTIDGITQHFFEIRLRNGGLFPGDDFQYSEPRLRYFQIVLAEQADKSIVGCGFDFFRCWYHDAPY